MGWGCCDVEGGRKVRCELEGVRGWCGRLLCGFALQGALFSWRRSNVV
jgi:hypothetical protein